MPNACHLLQSPRPKSFHRCVVNRPGGRGRWCWCGVRGVGLHTPARPRTPRAAAGKGGPTTGAGISTLTRARARPLSIICTAMSTWPMGAAGSCVVLIAPDMSLLVLSCSCTAPDMSLLVLSCSCTVLGGARWVWRPTLFQHQCADATRTTVRTAHLQRLESAELSHELCALPRNSKSAHPLTQNCFGQAGVLIWGPGWSPGCRPTKHAAPRSFLHHPDARQLTRGDTPEHEVIGAINTDGSL